MIRCVTCFYLDTNSHNFNLIASKLQLFLQIFKRLVEYLVHDRRAADPNPGHLPPIWIELLSDVVFVPSARPNQFIRIFVFLWLRVSHCELEVVQTQFLVQVEQGLAQFETDRIVLVLERDVEVELEMIAEHRVCLLGELVQVFALLVTASAQCRLFRSLVVTEV